MIPIDEVVKFDAITEGSTGAATDADSTPTFEVFEEDTDTDIGVGGNLTKRTSKTGNYRGSFTASAANGFEAGKWYSIIVSATVGGVAMKQVAGWFRVAPAESQAGVPKTDLAYWLGTAPLALSSQLVQVSVGALQAAVITATSIASDAITAAKIAANAITAAKLDPDVTTELQAGLATAAAVATLQTSVDDLPTNAELATSQAAADDATLAAIATLQTTADDIPTNAELATALAAADDAVLVQVALVKAKTDNLPSDPADQSLIIDATNALATLIGDVPTNAELATALAAADDAVLAAIAALNNLSAAQVNAEVLDVLATDTHAEPTGVPGTTVSYGEKLDRLYQALRSGIDINATKKQFRNNAGTVIWEKDIADDGTTYTESTGNAP